MSQKKNKNARAKKVKARLAAQRQKTQGRSQQLGMSTIQGDGQDLMQLLSGSYLEMLNEKGIQHEEAVGMLHFKNNDDKKKFMYALCDEEGNSEYLTTNVTRTSTIPGLEGVLTAVSYKRDMIGEAVELYDTFYGKSETQISFG